VKDSLVAVLFAQLVSSATDLKSDHEKIFCVPNETVEKAVLANLAVSRDFKLF